ncbi:MAG: hypothetical protein RSF37_05545 [Clostridium sp.]|uniref:hypothetical protein n=1 Tax=Clostridium sp. TaxID=1506 RepID=UPI002FC7A299
MKGEKNYKAPKGTLILNILATLMGACAVFNIYTSNIYINNLIKQGLDVSKQLTDVISYYLNAVTPYIVYCICFVALGYIINKVVYLTEIKEVNAILEKSLDNKSLEDDEGEIDILFEGIEEK